MRRLGPLLLVVATQAACSLFVGSQCLDDTECAAFAQCVDGACVAPVSGPDDEDAEDAGAAVGGPSISAIDGDGTARPLVGPAPDGIATAHRVRGALVVQGTGLATLATAALVDAAGDEHTLQIDGTEDDVRRTLGLPTDLAAGAFTLALTTAAGTARADVFLLQGEPGRAGLVDSRDATTEECVGGGVAVRTGEDADGDDVLDDEEATTRFVCAPVSDAAIFTCAGDVCTTTKSITTPSVDTAALHVTGDVLVDGLVEIAGPTWTDALYATNEVAAASVIVTNGVTAASIDVANGVTAGTLDVADGATLPDATTVGGWDVTREIRDDVVIQVGVDVATIPDALAAIEDLRIAPSGSVEIQVPAGEQLLNSPLTLNHPDGGRLRIVGTGAASTTLRFPTTSGVVLDGSRLGLLDGVTLRGGDVTQEGVSAHHGAYVMIGSDVVVRDFDIGVRPTTGAIVSAIGVDTTSNVTAGFAAISGAILEAHTSTSTDDGNYGFVSQIGAVVIAPSSISTNAANQGYFASNLGLLYVPAAQTLGGTTSARTMQAVQHSYINASSARGETFTAQGNSALNANSALTAGGAAPTVTADPTSWKAP